VDRLSTALPARVPLVRLPQSSWQPVHVHVGVDEVVEGVIVAAVRSAALGRSRDLALDRRRRGERRWPDLLGGRPSGGGGSEVQDGGVRARRLRPQAARGGGSVLGLPLRRTSGERWRERKGREGGNSGGGRRREAVASSGRGGRGRWIWVGGRGGAGGGEAAPLREEKVRKLRGGLDRGLISVKFKGF